MDAYIGVIPEFSFCSAHFTDATALYFRLMNNTRNIVPQLSDLAIGAVISGLKTNTGSGSQKIKCCDPSNIRDPHTQFLTLLHVLL